jgi:hypothetical protein
MHNLTNQRTNNSIHHSIPTRLLTYLPTLLLDCSCSLSRAALPLTLCPLSCLRALAPASAPVPALTLSPACLHPNVLPRAACPCSTAVPATGVSPSPDHPPALLSCLCPCLDHPALLVLTCIPLDHPRSPRPDRPSRADSTDPLTTSPIVTRSPAPAFPACRSPDRPTAPAGVAVDGSRQRGTLWVHDAPPGR